MFCPRFRGNAISHDPPPDPGLASLRPIASGISPSFDTIDRDSPMFLHGPYRRSFVMSSFYNSTLSKRLRDLRVSAHPPLVSSLPPPTCCTHVEEEDIHPSSHVPASRSPLHCTAALHCDTKCRAPTRSPLAWEMEHAVDQGPAVVAPAETMSCRVVS